MISPLLGYIVFTMSYNKTIIIRMKKHEMNEVLTDKCNSLTMHMLRRSKLSFPLSLLLN